MATARHDANGGGDIEDPVKNWMNVWTVADFVAYITAFDQYHYCEHDRLWTRCWSCGHFEDYLEEADNG